MKLLPFLAIRECVVFLIKWRTCQPQLLLCILPKISSLRSEEKIILICLLHTFNLPASLPYLLRLNVRNFSQFCNSFRSVIAAQENWNKSLATRGPLALFRRETWASEQATERERERRIHQGRSAFAFISLSRLLAKASSSSSLIIVDLSTKKDSEQARARTSSKSLNLSPQTNWNGSTCIGLMINSSIKVACE